MGEFSEPVEMAIRLTKALPEDTDPDSLNQVEFKVLMSRLLGSARFAWTMIAPNGDPVGVCRAHDLTERVIEPHVRWFPWATPRNKLECALRLLQREKRNKTLFLITDPKNRKFWHNLQRYGVLRPIGQVYNFYRHGDTVDYWQSV